MQVLTIGYLHKVSITIIPILQVRKLRLRCSRNVIRAHCGVQCEQGSLAPEPLFLTLCVVEILGGCGLQGLWALKKFYEVRVKKWMVLLGSPEISRKIVAAWRQVLILLPTGYLYLTLLPFPWLLFFLFFCGLILSLRRSCHQ